MLPNTATRIHRLQQRPNNTYSNYTSNAIHNLVMNRTRQLFLVIFLTLGLLLFLYNAFGAKMPSPDNNNNNGNKYDAASLSDVVAMGHRYSDILLQRNNNNNAAAAKLQQKEGGKNGKSNTGMKNKNTNNRLAIVIPYLPPSDGAPTFPSYFELFAMSAAGSADSIDYLIFHCFIPPSLLPHKDSLPANVKLIDLNIQQKNTNVNNSNNNDPTSSYECGMANLFLRVTDQRQAQNLLLTPLHKLTQTISHQIINLPYILVEYKPAFGHIFADYLADYSHWGYSDLDVVLGDMSRWITHDEWNTYDIVTYGFGDQDKLYLRGQFTFHRNDPDYINQLWRDCKYLSEMDVRYSEKKNSNHFQFESAEGCYSKAVIGKKDLKVKWAVKAFSDVKEGSAIYAHGMYLSLGSSGGGGGANAKSVLYTASNIHSGSALSSLPHDWFQDTATYPLYSQNDMPLQKYIGEKTQVQTYRTLYNQNRDEALKDIKCMYWAPKTYQMDICTVDGNVGGDEVVTLEDGVLWKQKFETMREGVFPEGIVSFPFFHFQEWKRVYRTTQLLNSHNIRQSTSPGLIITKEGTLPLFPSKSSPSSGWSAHPHRPWSSSKTTSSFDWTTADTGATPAHASNNRFCLKSAKKGNPVGATVCKVAASWPPAGSATHNASSVDGSALVHILRSPASSAVSLSKSKTTTVRGGKNQYTASSPWWDDRLIDANNDVTLALTLQITAAHMKEESVVQSLLALADSNIFMWGGRQPSVLVIHVDSTVRSDKGDMTLLARTVQLIKDKFALDESLQSQPDTAGTAHLQNSLIAIIDSHHPTVSRKALMNMASHAAPTRWIVSGLELERGLVLSPEASVYAMREAKVYTDLPGHVFVMPQFASKRDDTRLTTGDDKNRFPEGRVMFSSVGADLLPAIRGKQSMTSNLSEYDCSKCLEGEDEVGAGEGLELVDDEAGKRRLTDVSLADKTVEEQLEDAWWDLSVADVYGTPGGFNGQSKTSLDAIAKNHNRIEVSLMSLLDRSEDHLEFLRYSDKSPIVMIDRLGPLKDMLTLDLASEVEEFGGRACFHFLRLAQLAVMGYKISVLPGAFAASYPKTRAALCTDAIMEQPQYCDCDFESESTMREILIDEVKRPGKVAVLLSEFDSRVNDVKPSRS